MCSAWSHIAESHALHHTKITITIYRLRTIPLRSSIRTKTFPHSLDIIPQGVFVIKCYSNYGFVYSCTAKLVRILHIIPIFRECIMNGRHHVRWCKSHHESKHVDHLRDSRFGHRHFGDNLLSSLCKQVNDLPGGHSKFHVLIPYHEQFPRTSGTHLQSELTDHPNMPFPTRAPRYIQ